MRGGWGIDCLSILYQSRLTGYEIQHGVAADDRNAFDDGLGDPQAVERIFVVKRQRGQRRCVLWLVVQIAETVLVDAFLHEELVGLRQDVFLDADLDGNLPIARRTDQLLVGFGP